MNPILQYGLNELLKELPKPLFYGLIIPDLPLEEAGDHQNACHKVGIDPIFLLSPSTPKERIIEINQHSRGMLYYASRQGVTGVKHSLPDDFVEKIKLIQSIATLPVVAGFGIANRKMAADVLSYADGFVVGSLFVEAVAQGISATKLMELAKSIDPR